MALQEWEKSFETGIEDIDRQHQELFRRIDQLLLAIYQGRGRLEVGKMLDFLESYVDGHFKIEEQLMRKHGYPGYDAHVAEHLLFSNAMNSIRKEFEKKGADSYMAIRVEKEVSLWWKQHILQTDMRYVPDLKPEHD